MVALLLILRDCGVAAKNTLFKHFLRSDRPQLSSACTKNQLSNVPSEIFNLKRNQPRNLHKQICNFREQVVRAGCKLLRANCQSKYQHCGGSLQSCAEKNIRFDCKRSYQVRNKWEERSKPWLYVDWAYWIQRNASPGMEPSGIQDMGASKAVLELQYAGWGELLKTLVEVHGALCFVPQ